MVNITLGALAQGQISGSCPLAMLLGLCERPQPGQHSQRCRHEQAMPPSCFRERSHGFLAVVPTASLGQTLYLAG